MALLRVPYYKQPNGYTCQSTCLKMFAAYLEQKKGITIYEDKEKTTTIKASQLGIMKIWKEINKDPDRYQIYDWRSKPLGRGGSKGMEITVIKRKHRNYWNNFVWWLENHCSGLDFEIDVEKDTTKAANRFKKYIDEGYPVMVGTTNTTAGHIILVIGYAIEDTSSPLDVTKMAFICHDPYGKYSFNVEKKIWLYKTRKRKTDHLTSEDIRRKAACGGDSGVGKAVEYDYRHVGRMKKETNSFGSFHMIYVKV
jgi:hypothetical protein